MAWRRISSFIRGTGTLPRGWWRAQLVPRAMPLVRGEKITDTMLSRARM
jgi:hypothetical protein